MLVEGEARSHGRGWACAWRREGAHGRRRGSMLAGAGMGVGMGVGVLGDVRVWVGVDIGECSEREV